MSNEGYTTHAVISSQRPLNLRDGAGENSDSRDTKHSRNHIRPLTSCRAYEGRARPRAGAGAQTRLVAVSSDTPPAAVAQVLLLAIAIAVAPGPGPEPKSKLKPLVLLRLRRRAQTRRATAPVRRDRPERGQLQVYREQRELVAVRGDLPPEEIPAVKSVDAVTRFRKTSI
ncbi:hypothetical protein H0H92_011865 [Tricholoma furcatifolium]|nr:hypothetical protein H0H92_011865 [Tricholoma furcatifolium]